MWDRVCVRPKRHVLACCLLLLAYYVVLLLGRARTGLAFSPIDSIVCVWVGLGWLRCQG